VEQPPQDSDAILDESLRLSRAGEDEANERLMRAAAEANPEDAQLAMRMAEALTYRAANDADAQSESYAWALRARTVSPEDPHILFRAAAHVFFLGDVEDSRELLRETFAHCDEDFIFAADAVHLVGRQLLWRGEKTRGEEALVAAFDEAPETTGHGRVLAEFYEGEGRLQEAARVAQQTLEHFPGDEVLQRLAAIDA